MHILVKTLTAAKKTWHNHLLILNILCRCRDNLIPYITGSSILKNIYKNEKA